MIVGRRALAIAIALGGVACSVPKENATRTPDSASATTVDAVPTAELYKVASDSAILSAARALMLSDSNVALTTVDESGQPRVRTTKAFVDRLDPADPARGVTVWIMTRLTTRKVDQIRKHPKVTLYFNNDARVEYATIMGTAVIHTDSENPDAKHIYDADYAKFFWPDFPKDFVMLEVKPRWLEYLGPAIAAHPDTWRPQAVVFEKPDR